MFLPAPFLCPSGTNWVDIYKNSGTLIHLKNKPATVSITAKCSDMFGATLNDGRAYDGYVPGWMPGELRKILLTGTGKDKTVKEIALDEIINRAFADGAETAKANNMEQ